MHRFDVKKIAVTLFLGVLFAVLPAALLSQNLEIHYINVQQGQSTLIIGPNGTVILYDGGYDGKGTSEVVPYLQSLGITTTQQLDYIMTSHRHTDHYVGLTEVMNYGYDAAHVYDNGSDNTNTYFQAFETAAAGTTAGGVTAIPLGHVIDLGNGATATCVATNGSVLGVGAIPGGTDNENDRSIALLVKYGDFDFILTGDMGGGADDSSCTGRGTSQANIETPLSLALVPGGANPMLTSFGVEVAHVAHHGSESSCNSDYMNLLSPAVACISVGDGQSTNWYHPRQDVVEQVLLAQASCITAPAALVLQTEEGSPAGSKTSYEGYCVGDIVITSDGGDTYTVNGTGAVSQGPNETAAAGLPATYYTDESTGGNPAPLLYSIHEENITETSADIVWSTNKQADSLVRYGTVSGTYTQTVTDAVLGMAHSLSLTGLTTATTYYYQVESTDDISQTTTSTEYSFTTTGGSTGDSTIVFSEIFYDTPGTDGVEEWIEIYNNTSSTVDISGWTITDNNGTGSTVTIAAGATIRAGGYYTIAADSAGFNALYGFDADAYGSIPGLNNSGDSIVLKDASAAVMDEVAWEGGASGGIPATWGSTSDPSVPTGSTIVRTTPSVDTDTYADWSEATGNGNPQTQALPPTAPILFTEVFYDTLGDETAEEWIELYNNSDSTADLSNWTIIDNNGTGYTYTFPSGTTMAAGSYLTVARQSAGFTALYGYEADLYGSLPYLNNGGDTIILYDAAANAVDAVAWEGGASAGVPDGWGSTSDPWAGAGNTIVRADSAVDTDTHSDWSYAADGGNPQTQASGAAKIVFSEIFYDSLGDENVEEWFEIYNNSTTTADLSDWTVIDNNGTGYTYTFPAGTTMAGGTYMTIARNSAGFVALYGYEADLYGSLPYLNNGGDTLILSDAEGNAVDAVAWEGGASSGVPEGWGSTSDPWASAGSTVVRSDVTVDTDTFEDWTYAADGGNPQTQVPPTPTVPAIVFSEVLYDSLGNESVEEWFELYNNTTATVEIGGWVITDNNGTGASFTIPAGATIQPASYYTVARNTAGFVALYGYEPDADGSSVALNNSGETLILYDGEGNQVDAVTWEGGASAGIAEGWGSTSNPWASAGNTVVRTDPTVDTDTFEDWGYAADGGNPQTQKVPGNIMFSEIFYDTPGTESQEEWVELYNNSTFDVNVGAWTITDNNGTGSTFTIPDGTMIAAGTYLTIAVNSTGFNDLYNYDADVYGSLPALNNSGDTLILKDSMDGVKDFVAWEGGASSGIPDGWGSTSAPYASSGNTIVRADSTIDTDTYEDWTYDTANGNPQTQAMGIPDLVPPVISAVTAHSITIDSAVIDWTTDEDADSVVEYGLASASYDGTAEDATLNTSHSMILTGLSSGTTYFFRVKSSDAALNASYSDEYTFTTPALMINEIAMEKFQVISNVYAEAVVSVTTAGAPVEGATVDITWSGSASGTAQAVTDATGQATFESDAVSSADWALTITVDNISKGSDIWDSANSETTETLQKNNDGIAAYSLFSTNSLYLKTRAVVNSGNIGVLDATAGPWLQDREVVLSTNVYLNDAVSLYGNSVKLKSGSSVNDVYCNELVLEGGTVRGTQTTPLALPLNVTLPTFPVPAPGSENIDVTNNETYTLAPGSYGSITLENNAVLIFTGGTYHLENLDIGNKSQLRFQAPTELIINDRLVTGINPVIAPEEGAAITARDIVIYVNGIDLANGTHPETVNIGIRHQLKANIYAPNGTIFLKSRGVAEGGFIGKDVLIDFYVQVTRNSIFE